jgi:type IV secretory pathway VirB4 component
MGLLLRSAKTQEQHDKEITVPAFCELLPIRDMLDNLIVRTNGTFVAGYKLGGVKSFFHDDDARNNTKRVISSLLHAIPEESVRLQLRYEVAEGTGGALERFKNSLSESANEAVKVLDLERRAVVEAKESQKFYLERKLNCYVIWDPSLEPGKGKNPLSSIAGFSFSSKKNIEMARKEYEDTRSRFESILSGLEVSFNSAHLSAARMSHEDMFLELKRAIAPHLQDNRPYKDPGMLLQFRSAREQVVNVDLDEIGEEIVNIGGLLYSTMTLKDLPDDTYPGILREMLVLDFPYIVNMEVTIPDQGEVRRDLQKKMKKMRAAQYDSNGNYRPDIEASLTEGQLAQTLQQIIASSIKTCEMSFQLVFRSTTVANTEAETREALNELQERKQALLSAFARMSGARPFVENKAKKRLYIGSLPGMSEPNRREHVCLTLHAADFAPMEMPWSGTESAQILVEDPWRSLVPFSVFDNSFSNSNMLLMAKSGGGKSFAVQTLLGMLARSKPLVSIVERGDSYRPLVELMGGHYINVDMDCKETINPWDLPPGQTEPSNEQIAFLVTLTKYMVGVPPAVDPQVVENLLTEAIKGVYDRTMGRATPRVPTFSELMYDLRHWEAKTSASISQLAKETAFKMQQWVEKGPYADLFDRPTTMKLNSDWLYFNIEGLSKDPRLEPAMSLLIAHTMAGRSSGATGQQSIVILDECWSLMDNAILAPEVVQLFRTARKRGSSIWAVSQSAQDFVGTPDNPRPHGAGIVENAELKLIGPQKDGQAAREALQLSHATANQISALQSPVKGKSADAVFIIGKEPERTHVLRLAATPLTNWIFTTFPREREYRRWYLAKHADKPLIQRYAELAELFPVGLADLPPLPEEKSGEVKEVLLKKVS